MRTRPRILSVAVVVVGLALLVTGCSGDGEGLATKPTASASAPGAESVSESTPPDGRSESPGADGDQKGDRTGDLSRQERVLSTLPGSKGQGCVTVAGHRDVRSGDFAAGPFDEVEGPKRVRLYFIPVTAPKRASLTVEAERVGGSGAVSWSQDVYSDANRVLFYDTTTTFPRSGTWRLQVRAGSNRGCFVAAIG